MNSIKKYKLNQKIGNCLYLGNDEMVAFGSGNKSRKADFKCECGNIFRSYVSLVKSGHTKSCGCLHTRIMQSKASHGHCINGVSTSEYLSWQKMKDRCYKPKTTGYKYWGGRGIKVCDRWLESFENFLEDMGNKPTRKHTIERLDNDGNYDPSNCKWATRSEQMLNQRPKKGIVFNGQCKSLKAWCRELNIHYNTAIYRAKQDWVIEDILSVDKFFRYKK